MNGKKIARVDKICDLGVGSILALKFHLIKKMTFTTRITVTKRATKKNRNIVLLSCDPAKYG